MMSSDDMSIISQPRTYITDSINTQLHPCYDRDNEYYALLSHCYTYGVLGL